MYCLYLSVVLFWIELVRVMLIDFQRVVWCCSQNVTIFRGEGKKEERKKKRTFSCHFKRPSFYESLFPPSTLVVKSARIYFYPSINAFLNLSIFLWMSWCTARTGAKYLDFNLSCSLSSLI